jgi:hypothetical protein
MVVMGGDSSYGDGVVMVMLIVIVMVMVMATVVMGRR